MRLVQRSLIAAHALLLPAAAAAVCEARFDIRAEYYVFDVGARTSSVAAADCNEDGHPDVVSASADGRSLTVLLGAGGFHLKAARVIDLGAPASWVATADLDADGHADLAVTGPSGTTVLLGDGHGDFRTGPTYPCPARFVALVDMNGDGFTDLALNDTSAGITFLYLRGLDLIGRRDLPGWHAMSLGDMDEDGDLDLVTSGYGAEVRLNAGDGSFGAPTAYGGGFDCLSREVYVADLNGDQHLDILGWGCPLSGVSLRGLGDGTFTPSGDRLLAPGPARGAGTAFNERPEARIDIDGDGALDVVDGGGEPRAWTVRVHPGDGSGSFVRRPAIGISAPAGATDMLDMNGDGLEDLVVPYDGGVSIILRDPNGGFGARGGGEYFSSGNAFADVNGDGYLDSVNGEEGVFLGNENARFWDPPIRSFETPLRGLDAGDVDGDGRVDVIGMHFDHTRDWPSDGPVLLLKGNADGTFRPSAELGISGNQARLKDLDGDGRLDLLLSTESRGVSVFYGNGDGTFATGPTLEARGLVRAHEFRFGDIDGDRRLDLVHAAVLYRNTGRSYQRIPVTIEGAPWLADVDGDGRDDILSSGLGSNGGFHVYVSNGDGSFREPRDEAYGPGGFAMADRSGREPQEVFVVTSGFDVHGETCGYVTLDENHRHPDRAPETMSARAVVSGAAAADHGWADVSIAGVSDPDGDAVSVRVTGITQDEPVGSGRPRSPRRPGFEREHCPDAVVTSDGARVRWERDGAGNGRVYSVRFLATDACGAASEGRASVCVPHDAASAACVDDGQHFDALACPGDPDARAPNDELTTLLPPIARASGAELRYRLAAAGDVRLEVYDLLGRRRAVLAAGPRQPGEHGVNWDAHASAGIYFARLSIGDRRWGRRFILNP